MMIFDYFLTFILSDNPEFLLSYASKLKPSNLDPHSQVIIFFSITVLFTILIDQSRGKIIWRNYLNLVKTFHP